MHALLFWQHFSFFLFEGYNITMTPGHLYIISAPSGAGKTSLVKALIEHNDNIMPSVSHTTRPRRSGEVDGVDYHFVSDSEFRAMLADNAFLEYAEVFDYFYGTSRYEVDSKRSKGIDVILEIDWQGARQIHALIPEAISIFILPPSLETLLERLNARGQDHQSVIERRMTAARKEMVHYDEYQYLIINDVFSDALDQLHCIVTSNRLKLKQQQHDHAALLHALIGEEVK